MKTWLTVAEGAEYSGVSRDTIYTACERGELRHARREPGAGSIPQCRQFDGCHRDKREAADAFVRSARSWDS